MGLNKPILLQLDTGTYAVFEYGLDTMFLLEGRERALIIDTGMGLCDFKSIVSTLTRLPCTVVLTHGHQDHCGGMDQFQQVWLHPADHQAARAASVERRKNSCRQLRGLEGDADVWDYDEQHCRAWKQLPELLSLEDGQVFDLGDRPVEVVYTPGHSPGSCCLIDHKHRILFSGDACNVSLRCTDCSVETGLKGLRHLKEKESLFDRNYNGHLAYSSGMNHVAMPKGTLDDCITAMERVLAGADEPHTSFYSQWRQTTVNSYLWGCVKLAYDPARIREE